MLILILFNLKNMKIFLVLVMLIMFLLQNHSTEDSAKFMLYDTISLEGLMDYLLMLNMMDILKPNSALHHQTLLTYSITMMDKKSHLLLMDYHLHSIKPSILCLVNMDNKISLNSRIGDLHITNLRKVSTIILEFKYHRKKLPDNDLKRLKHIFNIL